MTSPSLRLTFAVAALAALAAAQQPRFVNGHHEDPRIGYRIRVPDKWTLVPVDIDEKWIVAKYLCHREYAGKLDYNAYKPEMRVIHFSPEKAKVKEKVEKHDDTVYLSKSATFRNYKDWFGEFIKTTGLGFHIESETEEVVGGIPVKKLEIMTTATGDKVLKFVCWIFERQSDGSTVAVEFSQLHDWWKNVHTDFDRSLRSFKFIEAQATTAGATDAELETPMWTRDRGKWREMPKLERWKIRQAMEVKRRERILEHIPEGWTTQDSRSKRFVALSHADRKYTTLVLDMAEATWEWLDKRFADLSDDYVMAGVIRICKDRDEAMSYAGKSADYESFSADDREIVDYKDRDAGSAGGGQRSLISGLTYNYLFDKDPYAYYYRPGWVVTALALYLSTAELEGKKLNFKTDTWERVLVREAERENSLRTVNELISTPSADWPKEAQAYWRFQAQLSALIRFLESPQVPKQLKGFLPAYMKAAVTAGETWVKSRPATAQAKTEEEEEARAKDRNKARREVEKFVLDIANKEVANFSPKDWQQIEVAWKKWLTK